MQISHCCATSYQKSGEFVVLLRTVDYSISVLASQAHSKADSVHQMQIDPIPATFVKTVYFFKLALKRFLHCAQIQFSRVQQ